MLRVIPGTRATPANTHTRAMSYGRLPTAEALSLVRLFIILAMTREKVIAFLVPEKVKKKVCWASICVGVRFDPEQGTTLCMKQQGSMTADL